MRGNQTRKDDNRYSPKLENARQLRIEPGPPSHVGSRIGGSYLTYSYISSFLDRGNHRDEPAVDIDLHSKARLDRERWRGDDVYKEPYHSGG
jgi:hypothetical protein